MSAAILRMRRLRVPFPREITTSLEGSTHVQWCEALDARELDAIAQWLQCNTDATVRLCGAATAQLEALLQRAPVERLELEVLPGTGIPRVAAAVRELALCGFPAKAEQLLLAFPGLRMLRVDARGEAVDFGWLAPLQSLRSLSVSAARLVNARTAAALSSLAVLEISQSKGDAEPVFANRRLVALRLAGVAGVRRLDALAGQESLRRLALEDLTHLESLAPLERVPNVRSLELRRLWQFNVGDAHCVARMAALEELTLDIGGRRKNVEITKHLQLPEPEPFDAAVYDLTTSYEFGVQRRPANLSSVTTSGVVCGFPAENGGV